MAKFGGRCVKPMVVFRFDGSAPCGKRESHRSGGQSSSVLSAVPNVSVV